MGARLCWKKYNLSMTGTDEYIFFFFFTIFDWQHRTEEEDVLPRRRKCWLRSDGEIISESLAGRHVNLPVNRVPGVNCCLWTEVPWQSVVTDRYMICLSAGVKYRGDHLTRAWWRMPFYFDWLRQVLHFSCGEVGHYYRSTLWMNDFWNRGLASRQI